MQAKAQFDAVVVGAGPAGSATASLLARKGFSVLLLDRAAFPREKPCGEYTSPHTETVLARIGALSSVEPYARRLPELHLISRSGRRVVMDYAGDSAGKRTVLATARTELDAALVDFARRSGAEVHERVKVESVIVRDGRASGVVMREGGSVREVEARIVIGADGGHSVVARSLGLVAPLRWPRNLGMVARYRGFKGLDSWGEMHVSTQGYAGLAPLRNGLVNVGLVMPMTRAAAYNGLSANERFEKFYKSFPLVAECLRDAERVSQVRGSGPIGSRVTRTYGDGFLLVGDAAGFFDPFTGEGVHKALRGAELASEAASSALSRNDLSAQSLKPYADARRKEFATKELVVKLVQSLIGSQPVTEYVTSHLESRPTVRSVITGVMGDYIDAKVALRPTYIWSLLRP